MQSENTNMAPGRARISMRRIATYLSLFLGLVITVCVVTLILFPDLFFNNYFKNKIVIGFTKAYPDYSLMISDLHINTFGNSVDFGDIIVNSKDSTFICSFDKSSISGVNFFKLFWKGSIDSNDILSLGAVVQGIEFKFNKLEYKFNCGKLKVSFKDSLFTADNLALTPLSNDNQFFEASEFRRTKITLLLTQLKGSGLNFISLFQGNTFKIRNLQINEITSDFLVNMFKRENKNDSDVFKNNKMFSSFKEKIKIDSFNVTNCKIKYTECYTDITDKAFSYKFVCGEIHSSSKDSSLSVKDFSIYPLLDDNQYFDSYKYRRTRYRIFLRQANLNGIDLNGLINFSAYYVRKVDINEASLDVMVNMNKPYKREAIKPLMPNEILAAAKEKIQLDSIKIIRGKMQYGEIYVAQAKPALIKFDSVYLLASGINNTKNSDDAIIQVSSIFMNSSKTNMTMYVPFSSPIFSFRYTGTVSQMNLNRLNPFLEIGEHKRIKSGVLHASSCDIQVNNGIAKGSVKTEYEDFALSVLDSRTKSDKGILNRIKSFYFNTFKLNGKNMKDNNGKLKLGKIHYVRQRDDTFTQVLWFALRSGVFNIIGI